MVERLKVKVTMPHKAEAKCAINNERMVIPSSNLSAAHLVLSAFDGWETVSRIVNKFQHAYCLVIKKSSVYYYITLYTSR